MRILLYLVTGLCLVLAAASVQAREVQLGLESSLQAESNVLRQPIDPVADGALRLAPTIKIKDDAARFTYDVFYKPTYRLYFETERFRGWDQNANGTFVLNPSPADRLSLSGGGYSILARTVGAELAAGGPDAVAGQSNELTTDHFNARGRWTHTFGTRLKGSVGGDFDWWQFHNVDPATLLETVVVNWEGAGDVGMDYALDSRTSVGLNVRANYQQFNGERLVTDTDDGALRRPPSQTIVGRLTVQLARAITPTLTFTAQVGPTVFDTQTEGLLPGQEPDASFLVPRWRTGFTETDVNLTTPRVAQRADCGTDPSSGSGFYGSCQITDATPTVASILAADPDFDPGELVQVQYLAGRAPEPQNFTEVNYFALLVLEKRWRYMSASASYQRRESAGSSLGGSTILDYFILSGNWRPDPDWNLTFEGYWIQRQALEGQEVAVEGAILVDGAAAPPAVAGLAESTSLVTVPRPARTQDYDQILFFTTARYRWSRNIFLTGGFSYQHRFDSQVLGIDIPNTSFDSYVGYVKFTYLFDQFRF